MFSVFSFLFIVFLSPKIVWCAQPHDGDVDVAYLLRVRVSFVSAMRVFHLCGPMCCVTWCHIRQAVLRVLCRVARGCA